MQLKLVRNLSIMGGIVLLAVGAWIVAIMDNGTPDEFSPKAWPNTKELAEQAAINHFKNESNADIVIESVSHSGEYATSEIYIDGYVSNDQNQKFSATVNSSKNYKITNLTLH